MVVEVRKGKDGRPFRVLIPTHLRPDLNVLDYSLWHAINLQMRAQERAFSPRKAETEAEYLSRLRKTAWAMPAAQVEKAVASMHKRVRMVVKEKGNLFVE